MAVFYAAGNLFSAAAEKSGRHLRSKWHRQNGTFWRWPLQSAASAVFFQNSHVYSVTRVGLRPIFCFVFFKVCNHYTVSCYNNYLGCLDQDILIFYFLYAVFKVHARCDGCGHIKNRKVLEACFHKLFCFLMYRHLCRDRENLFSRLARSHSSLLTDVLSVIRNLNFHSNLWSLVKPALS